MDRIELSIKLKELGAINEPKIHLEQYSTDISTAVNFLLVVDSFGCLKGKKIADFGCGNGILGIGAALLGAGTVDMYDIDKRMVELANSNVEKINIANCKAYRKDFFDVTDRYDTIISNPPFGFQSTFRIRAFITKLKDSATPFFFIYKLNREIQNIARENELSVYELGELWIPNIASFHRKDKVRLPFRHP
ncbi:MAG: methyltransferase, partial [Candidatus Parvarchaeota archaeon]|nr:methyltransferase [Candidatus Parvarchaeota archaeon]